MTVECRHPARRNNGAIAATKVSAPIPACAFQGNERHDLPPSLVEDTAAHDQPPSAEISRQLFFGPKTPLVRSQDRQRPLNSLGTLDKLRRNA